MKKLIALLLCTVLLAGMTVCFAASDTWTCESCGRESSGKFCPYCGAAKPEEVIFPEAPAGTFSIRNGIRWGMSGYEVETREANPKSDEERYYSTEDGYVITNLYYDSYEKKASIFPASINYQFSRDKLFMVTYHAEYEGSYLENLEMNTYLKNAVTTKYGSGHEATFGEREKIRNVMYVIDNYFYDEDIKQITVWDLPEDTTAAFIEGYYLEDCRLVYFHYSTMLNGLPEDGVYNTNGL